MEQFITNLKQKINTEIQLIESEEDSLFTKSTKIIGLLEDASDQLKGFILDYTFKYQTEEIQFFKEIKPQLFSILIYYRKVYNLEMRMATGGKIDKKDYLEDILSRIKYFFDTNCDFYQYYRSGSTHLDKYYCQRRKSYNLLFHISDSVLLLIPY